MLAQHLNKTRYRLLILLSIVSGLIAYQWRDTSWLIDNYAANPSATFVGTLVLLFFIDRTTEQYREQERRKAERIALSQLRTPLNRLVCLFSDMIKAASVGSVECLPDSLDTWFSPPIASCIAWLDLDGDPGVLPKTTWSGFLSTELKSISDGLSLVIEKYVVYLDVGFVEDIETLRSHSYVLTLMRLDSAVIQARSHGIHRKYSLDGINIHQREYFDILLRVVSYYNTLANKPISVPANIIKQDVMPKAGSSRLVTLPDGGGVYITEQVPNLGGLQAKPLK